MSRKLRQLLLAPIIGMASFGALAEESCLKVVFDGYCLGGDMSAQLTKDPRYVQQERNGDRFAVVYSLGQESIYVLAYHNRIYKVLHRYDPTTVLRFNDLETILRGKYGPPQDLSRYPGYAHNRAARIGAIRRGEGEAELLWTPAGQPWSVTLGWTRELGITLDYRAKALDAEQRRAASAGL